MLCVRVRVRVLWGWGLAVTIRVRGLGLGFMSSRALAHSLGPTSPPTLNRKISSFGSKKPEKKR